MQNVFVKSALAGAVCIASMVAPAYAADMYMAVKAREGLTLNFAAVDSNNSAFFFSKGNGISERTAQGWYIQKLPADIDLSRMVKWCVTVMEPDELFEEGKCSRNGVQLPDDGIFKMVLDI